MKNKRYDYFILWLIGAIIFAVAINFLFKLKAPFAFMEVTWRSGEVLTYASTMLLAWIALKQNKNILALTDSNLLLLNTTEIFPESNHKTNDAIKSFENNKMNQADPLGKTIGIYKLDSHRNKRLVLRLQYRVGSIRPHYFRMIDLNIKKKGNQESIVDLNSLQGEWEAVLLADKGNNAIELNMDLGLNEFFYVENDDVLVVTMYIAFAVPDVSGRQIVSEYTLCKEIDCIGPQYFIQKDTIVSKGNTYFWEKE